MKITVTPGVAMMFRALELMFAAVIAGIVGYYIHPFAQRKLWGPGRNIFTETWAGLSILLSILWLIPPLTSKIPGLLNLGLFLDLGLSIGWFTAFGLLLNGISCGSSFFDLETDAFCRNWRTVQAFSFLSAIAWLLTCLFQIQFRQVRRRNNRNNHRGGGGGGGYY